MNAKIQQQRYGSSRDGQPLLHFILRNANGMTVELTSYGARIVSIQAPDMHGDFAEVVLGYDTLAAYESDPFYLGCTVGRYANRIARGQFSLNGETYILQANDGKNCLHGGFDGLHRVTWQALARQGADLARVEFHHTSPAGSGGFPGKLELRVIYSLDDHNALKMEYVARPDRDTVINLTNHAYFNLSGDPASDILQHELQLFAEHFTPIDADLIPTGEIRRVDGTAFDFRQLTAIGARIDREDAQLQLAGGYDHNWVLNHPAGTLGLAARVVEPGSGRQLEIFTTQPGIQFYSGNMLDEAIRGKNDIPLTKRHGLCLETQHFPDSPNHPKFPSTVIRAGEVYSQQSVYQFSVLK